MKITNHFLVAVAALAFSGAILTRVQAAEATAPARPLRAQWLERASEKLGLTDDQVAKIKAEFQSEKGTIKGLIFDLHEARVGLRQAIQAPGATEDSVRLASAKVASVEADLAVERLKLYARISPILTTDQLEKLKEFRAKIDSAIDRAID